MSSVLENVGVMPQVWRRGAIDLTGDASVDVRKAISASGLDWEADKIPLVCGDNQQNVNMFAVRRNTDGRILGCVGKRYNILQNKDAFTSFQPFLEAKEAVLETAGTFENGSVVWILARILRNPIEIAPQDTIQKYILLSHSHDGKLSVRYGFTPIRVVCGNMLAMTHRNSESQLIRMRHSSQTIKNLSQIREIMNLCDAQFEANAEQYAWLANRDINTNDLRKYVTKVLKLDNPKAPANAVFDFTKNQQDKIGDIIGRFEAGMGNDLPDIKGTWWAAYNSVTEYLTHAYGKDADRRMKSVWMGSNFRINQKALYLALDMAS